MKKTKLLLGAFFVLCALMLFPGVRVYAGQTYTLSVKDGDDIYKEMKNVMAQAAETATAKSPSTVVIPAGNYTLSTVVRLYSNVTVDATGATITYNAKETHNMLISGTIEYNESSACSGYAGYENITIKGGTWISPSSNKASMVKIMHASNVVIEGAEFVGGGSAHQVELAAIDGLTVKNCTFRDFEGKKNDKSEALQLDIPCAESVYGDTYQDGTAMKNVVISGCTFSNVPRGLGTHTLLLGAWHKNIAIYDNTFENVTEECISTVNYVNCEIYNNTMTNCGGGILVQTYKKNSESIYSTTEDGNFKATSVDDMNISIHDNTMQIAYYKDCDEIMGIDLIGGIVTDTKSKGGDKVAVPKGDYRVKGVSIKNNTITTAGFGVHMQGACDVTIENNTIKGSGYSSKDSNKDKYDGFFIQTNSENVSVTGNTVTGASRCGIFVMEDASVTDVKNNTIKDCPKYGIGFYDNAGLTGTMSGNKISGKVDTGISVSTNCTLNVVTKNTVTGAKSNAMNIYLKCTVKEVSGNTFKNPGKNGVIVSTNSTVTTIKDNKITSPKEDGIQVYSKSKVTTISGNTIEKSTKDGIFLSTGCTVGTIKNNTIKNAKREGIQIYSKCKVTKGITGNKITSSTNNGMKITTNCTISEISGNTIKTAGSNGILLCNKSVVSKDVKKNKISKVKGTDVSVTSGAKISGKNKN